MTPVASVNWLFFTKQKTMYSVIWMWQFSWLPKNLCNSWLET